MKYVIALAIFFVAAPAFAFTAPVGIPNESGCGMGAFGLVRNGTQQDRKRPPLFVTGSLLFPRYFDLDGDDTFGPAGEGRSDTFYMVNLETCIANK